MKSEILKIAGVKSEKEFYKKYPTEAAFKKAHPKAFKGVQTKHAISKAQNYGSLMKDKNNNGVVDFLENQMADPRFGQTANYSDSGRNNAFPKPPLPTDVETPPYIAPETNPYGRFAPGNVNSWDIDNNGVPDSMQQAEGNPLIDNSSSTEDKKKPFNVLGAMNFIGGIANVAKGITAAEDKTKSMESWAGVSDVEKRAKISNAFIPKQPNEWYRGDDKKNIQSASELYYMQGRGSDAISQNGGRIGGNPTEIQNTYGIGSSVYQDLEDPNDVKAYQNGFGGFGGFGGGDTKPFLGGSALGEAGLFGGDTGGGSWLAGAMGGNSSWANAASMIPGPVGMFGTMAAQMFDPNPGKQRNAQNRMNSNNSFMQRLDMGAQARSPYSANTQNGGEFSTYAEGGYMNPEYNPQVIAMFGDHNAADFADYARKDQMRAGGHLKEYTPPSNRAMETYENGGEMNSYALGGKLKGHWGGKVEDMSYNPYLPGSGMTAMVKGASHANDGVGISYGGEAQNGYEYAANGANMDADIEAEGGEPIIEIAENGTNDTKAVVYGNIPLTKKMAEFYSNDPTIKKLAKDYDGITMKKIVASLTKDELKAAKNKKIASKISNNADGNTKWGKLDQATAQIIDTAGEDSLKLIAKDKMALADHQDALHSLKQKISFDRGKNISAEALGRGQIKDDLDPITKDAPLENPYAKSGAFLRKAQNSDAVNELGNHAFPSTGFGPVINNTTEDTTTVVPITTVTPADGEITEEQYNNFVKMYEASRAAGNNKNKDTLDFQRAYHRAFPKEAIAAIQKTTKENGLSNKAKELGLTVNDILNGKNVEKILQSNEDEYYGPRTEQYMSSVNSRFNKTPASPEMNLNTLGAAPAAKGNVTKPEIGVVPYKNNRFVDVANMLSPFFQQDNIPPIDPRQFAGEYVAWAQNTPEPVPMQKPYVELDPMTRVSYQDVRNASNASFRDVVRQNQGNPAVLAGMFGNKAMADQTSYADEFRTNQALEQQIYGGNRAKMNANQEKALSLNANQANLQSVANSKTKEINQKIASSFADKNMKYDADVMKYKVNRNLFPTFGYDQSGRINTRGFYKPTIPQIYGGKSTIEEVPVYGADGKIEYYKMQEVGKGDDKTNSTTNTTTTIPPDSTAFVPGQGYKKNGGSVVKNSKNSSVVRAYKNL